MLNVTKELTALARKLGYTGKAPDTVAKAINAITASVGEGGGSGCNCKTMVAHSKVDPETNTTVITDATAGEIYEAMQNGYMIFIVEHEVEVDNSAYIDGAYVIGSYFIMGATKYNDVFEFNCGVLVFVASSSNEYPRTTNNAPVDPGILNPVDPGILN